MVLGDLLDLSGPRTPILFLVGDACEDPTTEVDKLAVYLGVATSKLKYHSLGGEAAADTVSQLLTTAGIRGQWLVLQNVDQDPEMLELCAEFLDEAGHAVHENFR